MTIPITTRAGKGSPLTPTEMDTNLTNLARDASTTVQGQIRTATQSEANAFSSTSLALTPGTIAGVINNYFALLQFLGSIVAATPGKISIPNGSGGNVITLQWAYVSGVTESSPKFATFHTPFTSAVFCVQSTPIGTGSGGGSTDFWGVAGVGLTGCTVYSNYDAPHDGYVFAIGV